jgi:uncharacterized protein YggE
LADEPLKGILPMTFLGKIVSYALIPLIPVLAGQALADDTAPQKRTLSLAASGLVKTTPDKVDITTGVTSQAPTAKEALAKNSAAMAKVIDELKAQGIDRKDIQTTNFSVQPLYEERKEGRAPAIIGYQVTNSVRITVHDVGKLGQILDQVVSLGANEIGSIDFGVAEPEAMKDEARKLAVEKAIANAKLYAAAAGVSLGKILTIEEQEGGYAPRYAPAAPVEMAARAAPIEAGTTTVEARVRITFELE